MFKGPVTPCAGLKDAAVFQKGGRRAAYVLQKGCAAEGYGVAGVATDAIKDDPFALKILTALGKPHRKRVGYRWHVLRPLAAF